MTEFKPHNLILLTGAGFTKNFGGFLSNEMWARIFNNREVQSSPKLRQLLQENYDFEFVYSEVLISNQYLSDERYIIKEAVEGAYKSLDDAIKGWVFNDDSPYPVNRYGLGRLLNLFVGQGDIKGLFFTLNQDLFMERKFGYRAPGAPSFPEDFYHLGGRELQSNEFVIIPREGAVERAERDFKNHAGLAYVKLHGSYGWRSSDGANQMVIGKNKTDLIQQEPLLGWYLDLFQEAIRTRNKKLLIIGYGFSDQHINQILLDGVKNEGLKIYIISTKPAEELRNHFERGGHYYARDIMEGLSGYYPCSLLEMFPSNQTETIHYRELRDALTA